MLISKWPFQWSVASPGQRRNVWTSSDKESYSHRLSCLPLVTSPPSSRVGSFRLTYLINVSESNYAVTLWNIHLQRAGPLMSPLSSCRTTETFPTNRPRMYNVKWNISRNQKHLAMLLHWETLTEEGPQNHVTFNSSAEGLDHILNRYDCFFFFNSTALCWWSADTSLEHLGVLTISCAT